MNRKNLQYLQRASALLFAVICLPASYATIIKTTTIDRKFPVSVCPFPRPNCAETCNLCYFDGPHPASLERYGPLDPLSPPAGASPDVLACLDLCSLSRDTETNDLQFVHPGNEVVLTISRATDGALDVPVREIERIGVAVGSFHSRFTYYQNGNTKRPLDALVDFAPRDCARDDGSSNPNQGNLFDCGIGDTRASYVFSPPPASSPLLLPFDETFDSPAAWCLHGDGDPKDPRRNTTRIEGGRLLLTSDGLARIRVTGLESNTLYQVFGEWLSDDDGLEALSIEIEAPPYSFDRDRDLVFEPCDNCPEVRNPGQEDADGDGTGDACPPTPGP